MKSNDSNKKLRAVSAEVIRYLQKAATTPYRARTAFTSREIAEMIKRSNADVNEAIKFLSALKLIHKLKYRNECQTWYYVS